MGNSCFVCKNPEKDKASQTCAGSCPGEGKWIWIQQKDFDRLIDEKVEEKYQSERERLLQDVEVIVNRRTYKEDLDLFPDSDGRTQKPNRVIKQQETLIREREKAKHQIPKGPLMIAPLVNSDESCLPVKRGKCWLEEIDLERLIWERTEEKRDMTRYRLQRDLLVIARSTGANEVQEPFPDGAFEMMWENDIWGKVLVYIFDPRDVNNAYFACPAFAVILEERRKLMLLPEVLKILLNKEKAYKDCRTRILQFLNIRGVSKSWKKVADREIFDSDFLDEFWYPKSNWCYSPSFKLDEHNVDRALDYFTRDLNQSSSCSFRRLAVKRTELVDVPEDRENLRSFSRKVSRFLDFHGEYIWHFSYDGPAMFQAPIYDYLYVLRMIVKMPNLKCLSLHHVTNPREHNPLLVRYPFPALEHLTVLGCFYIGDSALLLQQIYENCPGIKNFRDQFVFEWHLDLEREMQTALLQQEVEHCVIYLRNVDFLRYPTWPLRVIFIPELTTTTVNCSTLWPILNRFSGTLEELTIMTAHRSVLKDDYSVRLRLPRLKILTMRQMCAGTIGFDDLLLLKSLEKIEILHYREESRPQDRNGLVRVYGIQNQMEMSNIWRVFPNLRKLVFGYPSSSNEDGIRYVRCGSSLTVSGKRVAVKGVRQILAI